MASIALLAILLKPLVIEFLCTDEMVEKFSAIYMIHFCGFFLLYTNEKLYNGILNGLDNQVYAMNTYLLFNVLGIIPIEIVLCYTVGWGLKGIWIG